jgi:SAM-dependent methyltransferase
MHPFHRLHALRLANDAKRDEMDAMASRFNALRTRHEDGTAPRAVTAYQLFQTPEPLAARMVGLAEIRPGCSVLEPSAGLGRLLRPILAMPRALVTACEISPDLCAELYQEFPEVRLLQGDFLTKAIEPFDRIVMNPPFHMRSDIRHIQHARQCLAPGGILVGLCLSGHRREETLRQHCDHWEIIPAGAFKQEGTAVETILFRIQG